MEGSAEAAVTTIISVEEQLRGWLSRIAKIHDPHDQIDAYQQLGARVSFLASFTFLPWDDEAANRFKKLRKAGIRIGTMDLKIACIALEHDALLLTRNIVDFGKVPGLRFENWLD
ncbi:MAG: type II toxin-antitoxin system VapC family toxin [Prosthecobacter sp.]